MITFFFLDLMALWAWEEEPHLSLAICESDCPWFIFFTGCLGLPHSPFSFLLPLSLSLSFFLFLFLIYGSLKLERSPFKILHNWHVFTKGEKNEALKTAIKSQRKKREKTKEKAGARKGTAREKKFRDSLIYRLQT